MKTEKRNAVLEALASKMEDQNSWGSDWGCQREVYDMICTLNEHGFDGSRFEDCYDDLNWAELTADERQLLEDEGFDEYSVRWETLLEEADSIWSECSLSIISEDYSILDTLENWEELWDNEDEITDFDLWVSKAAASAKAKELGITPDLYDMLVEYYEITDEDEIKRLANEISQKVKGCGVEGFREHHDWVEDGKSVELRMTNKTEGVDEYGGVEGAYKALKKRVDYWALKLRGSKTTDEEFELLKSPLANLEMDCAMLGVSYCSSYVGEEFEYMAEIFGVEKALEDGIFDLDDFVEVSSSGQIRYADVDKCGYAVVNK